MTRQEFIDNVNEWWELRDFCSDMESDICEDIYDEEERDSDIEEDLREAVGDYSWAEIRDMLDDIRGGYSYYHREGFLEYSGLDDSDFNGYKDCMLDWMDENEYWDEETDEDVDVFAEELEEERNEPEIEDEDFSVGDLIGMCSIAFVNIQQENMRRLKESEEALNQFVDINMPKVIH